MKIKLTLVSTFTLALSSLPAQTQELSQEDAEEAFHTRHAVMELLAYNMGPLGGMARGAVEYDPELAGLHAERLEMLAGLIPEVFMTDTAELELAETRALPAIWEDYQGFTESADALEEAARELGSAVENGEQQAVIEAIQGVGGTCGGCHEDYRAEEEE